MIFLLGLPKLNITVVSDWPKLQTLQVSTFQGNNNDKNDVDIVVGDHTDDEFCIIEMSKLLVLFQFCNKCGIRISSNLLQKSKKGGIVYVNYWCSGCNKRRSWNSSSASITSIFSAASIMAGIGMAKLVQFFTIICCVFPKQRALFDAAKQVVYPTIEQLYRHQQLSLFEQIRKTNAKIHLAMDGQYDSPGYCAYHCTVTAIEWMTGKVLSFNTVKRREVNNISSNAEVEAFRRLLSELRLQDISIASVTTDNSCQLNAFFRKECPDICHYLDLWHILRNIFRKFLPKFKTVYFLLFLVFLILLIF